MDKSETWHSSQYVDVPGPFLLPTQAGYTASTPHAGYTGSHASTQAGLTASTPHAGYAGSRTSTQVLLPPPLVLATLDLIPLLTRTYNEQPWIL